MIILIPTSPDIYPTYAVLKSLERQTIYCQSERIVTGVDSLGLTEEPRRQNIILSRNACLDKAKGHDFMLMQDSGCEMLNDNNLETMHNFLLLNRDFAAVALRRCETVPYDITEHPHVDLGSVLFNMAIIGWFGIRFHHEGAVGCECWNLARDIRAAGFRFGYLDNQKRINHTSTWRKI